MNEGPLEKLRAYLDTIPPGEIQDTSAVTSRLVSAWDFLQGGTDCGMASQKLAARMEEIEWDPPCLSFTIERHGGTVMGSTRAELQRWVVDLDEKTASWCSAGYRQLHPRARPVRVKPIAQEIADIIASGTDDPRLEWLQPARRVRVVLTRCLPPAAYKQTHQGRSRRLRKELTQMMQARGWSEVGSSARVIFEKQD